MIKLELTLGEARALLQKAIQADGDFVDLLNQDGITQATFDNATSAEIVLLRAIDNAEKENGAVNDAELISRRKEETLRLL